jgi:hypothetical protein
MFAKVTRSVSEGGKTLRNCGPIGGVSDPGEHFETRSRVVQNQKIPGSSELLQPENGAFMGRERIIVVQKSFFCRFGVVRNS